MGRPDPRVEMTSGPCKASNAGCEAPAGYAIADAVPPRTRARCYRCGENVCTNEGCSKRVGLPGRGKKRVRVCLDCAEIYKV